MFFEKIKNKSRGKFVSQMQSRNASLHKSEKGSFEFQQNGRRKKLEGKSFIFSF
jgi:hypothetical protein